MPGVTFLKGILSPYTHFDRCQVEIHVRQGSVNENLSLHSGTWLVRKIILKIIYGGE
jgi:hypothetical protein